MRVQELETAAEVKENEYLMSLKGSKKLENSTNSNSEVLTATKFSSKEKNKQNSTPKSVIDLTANDNSKSIQSLKIENTEAIKNKAVNISNGSKATLSLDKERECIFVDEDDSEFSTKALPGHPKQDYKDQDRDDLAKPEAAAPGTKTETSLQGKCNMAESSRVDIDTEMADICAGNVDEEVTLQANVKQVQPMVNIRKESPLTNSNSGMLLVDFGNRHLFFNITLECRFCAILKKLKT